jgi:hypothetical protein
VKPRFEVYKAVSQQTRAIFAEHTSIIEPLSLDEAHLDVTENLQGNPLARDVALAIRAKIKAETVTECVRWHLLQQVSGEARPKLIAVTRRNIRFVKFGASQIP